MMTFLALLTKEMRLRLRRERTIWVIVAYICFMGLLGWLTISRYSAPINYTNNALSDAGTSLYILLAQLQLLLIIFITPAFTATAINGEKERQTFDLLLCSRLSSFSVAAGKLLAGLANALLLVVASAPLFSLVFFFGGVAPEQVVQTLLVFAVTTVVVGAFGLFCSTLFKRPAISTSVAYLASLAWLGLPIVISFFLITSGNQGSASFVVISSGVKGPPVISHISTPIWLAANPLVALSNANPSLGNSSSGFNLLNFSNTYQIVDATIVANGSRITNVFTTSVGGLTLPPLNAYFILCLVASVLFFLASMVMIKPASLLHFFKHGKRLFRFPARDTKSVSEPPEPDEAPAKA
ncbi:MAG: ABC transporter permease [Ktedonobacteraceae bacterium]|nr:ABC transporter permease [Ktedonobacteraceae bacterium]MBO0790350.1 ABC transporter permease [Ktedonobacteraceae bacterium]